MRAGHPDHSLRQSPTITMIRNDWSSIMETRVLTAHVPVELAEQVDRHAKSLERSRGWIVKQALSEWLYNEEEKDRLTREALDSVERVGTIPHEEVVAYFESLGSDNPLPRPRPRKS